MRIHLINPSDSAFGVAVITPRWLYVLAAATPSRFGDPAHRRRDARTRRTRVRSRPATSSASAFTPATRSAATRSAGWRASAGRRSCSAASTPRSIPKKPLEHGGAHAVVKGDGESVWPEVAARLRRRDARSRVYDGGKVRGDELPAGPLGPAAEGPLHVGLGADGARLPEALLVLLGVAHRRPGAAQRTPDAVVREIVELRRRGFRFIALADDNFYPVTLDDLAMARRRADTSRLDELRRMRAERFELMERLAQLPARHGLLHADHDGGGRGSGVPATR